MPDSRNRESFEEVIDEVHALEENIASHIQEDPVYSMHGGAGRVYGGISQYPQGHCMRRGGTFRHVERGGLCCPQ